jgi:hypothetical protein
MVLGSAMVVNNLDKTVEEVLLEELGGDKVVLDECEQESKVGTLCSLGFVFDESGREIDYFATDFC